jgi:CheY-like chemotaxis protein
MGQRLRRERPFILVVDDDVVTAASTVEMLGRLGYKAVSARDIHSAMLALDDGVDLLFTDIVMPKIDGFMLADMAKWHRPLVRVLYTTGDTRHAARLMDSAGEVYGPILEKPYSEGQLGTAVALLLH